MSGVGLYGRPPSLHLPLDCVIGQGDLADAGDHKGPPRIHPTTLAPTESWMRVFG